MTTAALHLVDRHGVPVSKEIIESLEVAFRWAQWQFPLVDGSLLATWAEELGAAMMERAIQSPRRYAVAALHGKVREYFRAGGLREITVGASRDLEVWVGIDDSTGAIELSILFDQLRTHLNDRDRVILVLLRQDVTSPADIADALGVSYDAAAKAIQRVRERLREILITASVKTESKREVQR